MSAHNFNRQCGCSQCDRTEAAEEARDQHIEDHYEAVAKSMLAEPDFAWTAIGDLPSDVLGALAEDLGTFFERFHAGDIDADLAQAGYSLYRTLKPYVEAAAEAQAREDVAAEYDRDQKANDMPWDVAA